MIPNEEEPFDYVESHYTGQNWRYASTVLYRSECRKYWTDGNHWFVIDDFGFLKYLWWK